MGVKTLADTRVAIAILTTKPKNIAAPTAAEINAGLRAESAILKSDYKLGSTGSSTIPEQELCKAGEGNAPGPASYEGSMTPFLYRDADGKLSTEGSDVWEALSKEGATVWIVEREGPEHSKEFAADDLVDIYEVALGHPTKPDDRFSGYSKRTVALFVQDARENIKVAAA